MTREDKLYSMRMQELVMVAEKLGIKINTKAAKSKAIETILAAEEMNKKNEKELKASEPISIIKPDDLVPMPGTDLDQETGRERGRSQSCKVNDLPKPKRGQLIEYNGKSQNICAWAKELGKSANTLYARIYKSGWSVEDAFTK